jgi:hypothetical protein
MLKAQTYPGLEDHRAHFCTLLEAFADERYMTVEGKPIFVIFSPFEIPEVERVTDLWRSLAAKAGLKGLHLVAHFNAGADLPAWRWRLMEIKSILPRARRELRVGRLGGEAG